MGRIASLSDINKDSPPSSPPSTQSTYAGGNDPRGGGSGLSVLPPPNSSSSSDDNQGGGFDGIVGLARQRGEEGEERIEDDGVEVRVTMWRTGEISARRTLYAFYAAKNLEKKKKHTHTAVSKICVFFFFD